MDIQEQLAKHRQWLETDGQKGERFDGSGSNLSAVNLIGANLRKANLRGANLRGAKLSQADLYKADLYKADLNQADLYKADLSGTYLREAELNEANLIQSNLRGADLNQADLYKADLSGACLIKADLIDTSLIRVVLNRSDLSGANLRGSDLDEANLSYANLSYANLSGTELNGANLSYAKLNRSDLSGANLYNGTDLSGTDLSEANLSFSKLCGADLSCANLSYANLSDTDLSAADLSYANFSEANLTTSQVLGANFTDATLTGACIEDWHINSETVLDSIECQFIYLKSKWDKSTRKYEFYERRPSDESQFFASGDFVVLVRESLSTVDLIFRNGIDWKAVAISFEKFKAKSGAELTIEAIENKGNGDFVIKVQVPSDADKAKIEKFLKEEYQIALQIIDASYQERLKLQGDQLVRHQEDLLRERQEKTRLMGIIEIMAEKESSKYDLRGANIGNLADTVRDNARQQTNQYIYTSEQKQSLTEAAAEIQQLLEQLSSTYPTNTAAEKSAVATKAIEQIENNPDRKAKVLKALKVGGIAALKELVDPVAKPITNILFPMLEELTK